MDVFMHRSMHSWMQYVKASGLSMPQFSILMRLHYHGESGLSDIREHMDTSAAAASQLVDKLVQAGLLERAEASHDRRVKQVRLTPKGKAIIAQGIEERYRWVDAVAEKLSAEEQTQIQAALNLMIRAAEELEANPI
jgi:DNA-binding MarR family transcriptional regulator